MTPVPDGHDPGRPAGNAGPACGRPAAGAWEELDEAWDRYLKRGFWRKPGLLAPRAFRGITRRKGFRDTATEGRFREKYDRIMTAITLGVPDRVPVITNGLSFYPAFYSGVSFADYVMDREQCGRAFLKFARENADFDSIFPAQMINIGRLVERSRVDIIKLPGIHLQEDVPYQFNELERLKADEYPGFIAGGFDFFKRVVAPRISPIYDPRGGWGKRTLLQLAWELLSYARFYNRILNVVEREYGVPVETAAMFFEPYDLLAFLFRGLTGISGDLFRRPDLVEQAAAMLVPLVITAYENMVLGTGLRGAVILCERAFSLSPRQFARFSMPSLKKVVEALIDRGMVPLITLEGDCTHLFEFMLEFPPGKCVCNVDTGDIFRAKKVLEGHMCVAGNVPMNLMVLGTPRDIGEYCQRLLQEAAPGGGYILSGALGIPDNARPENVRAMLEYTIEHGEYP
jgi:hypothetical protein